MNLRLYDSFLFYQHVGMWPNSESKIKSDCTIFYLDVTSKHHAHLYHQNLIPKLLYAHINMSLKKIKNRGAFKAPHLMEGLYLKYSSYPSLFLLSSLSLSLIGFTQTLQIATRPSQWSCSR